MKGMRNMKNTFVKAFTSVFAAGMIFSAFTGCQFFSDFKNRNEGAQSGISIKMIDAASNARTALPEIVWSNYYYQLETWSAYKNTDSSGNDLANYATADDAITSSMYGVHTVYFTTDAFSKIENKVYPLPASVYRFKLTGKLEDGTPVICGTAVADLTSAGTDSWSDSVKTQYVYFTMYPLTGAKGAATITVKFPSDDTVAEVKAGWSENPVATADEVSAAGKLQTLSITAYETENQCVYSLTDLDSATRQYAIFYFYDDKGKLIMSLPESLYISGGCTSTSEIEVTADDYHKYGVTVNLKRNGETWASSGKTLKLVDKSDSSVEYTLSGSGGTYTGSVSEGTYYIYDGTENTGVEFNSANKSIALNYYVITLNACTGMNITAVSGGTALSSTKYLVVQNKDFVYKVSAASGYKAGSGFAITVTDDSSGSSVSAGTSLDTSLTVSSVSGAKTITVENAEAITYTISYSVASDETWQTGYPAAAPSTYTVENCTSISLPTLEHLRKNGSVLDGWKLSTDTSSTPTVFAHIPAGTTGNITLVPVWKESVKVTTETTTAADGTELEAGIYANGISMICKWKDSSYSETNLYVDFNSNGVIDSDDYQVVGDNSKTDFSNCKFFAMNSDGTLPASDYTFTMLGGKIASFTGLGATASNTSTVNISGYSVIGDGSSVGIDLTSLTNEKVNINGQMSGDYSITLETQYEYDRNDEIHIIANIASSSYAQLSKFTCIKKGTTTQLSIGLTDNDDGSTVIYLRDPDPISVPGNAGVNWHDESDGSQSTTTFDLGDTTNISIGCSVFSVTVANGHFNLTSLEMTDSSGTTIETENLGETTDGTYDTTLDSGHNYTYMHMFNKKNLITAETSTAFLKTIEFVKDDEDVNIDITIRLETVPYTDIETMGDKFSYYNGSFYLGVSNGSSITWDAAYNKAKATIFNGMNGYLINITSDVENNYIYKQMGLGNSWTGGARFDKDSDGFSNYDADVFPLTSIPDRTYVTKFRWQSGPEAGQWYQDGTIPSGKAGQKQYSIGSTNGYTNWDSGEPNDSYSVTTWSWRGASTTYYSEQCMHYITESGKEGKWNDYCYMSSNVSNYIVEFTSYTDTATNTKHEANYPSVKRTVSY